MASRKNNNNSIYELKKSLDIFKQKSEATSDIISDNISYIKNRFNFVSYNIKQVKSALENLSSAMSDIKKVK